MFARAYLLVGNTRYYVFSIPAFSEKGKDNLRKLSFFTQVIFNRFVKHLLEHLYVPIITSFIEGRTQGGLTPTDRFLLRRHISIRVELVSGIPGHRWIQDSIDLIFGDSLHNPAAFLACNGTQQSGAIATPCIPIQSHFQFRQSPGMQRLYSLGSTGLGDIQSCCLNNMMIISYVYHTGWPPDRESPNPGVRWPNSRDSPTP